MNDEQSPEQRLATINAERKELKHQIKSSRDIRLEEEAKMRIERDELIEKTQEKLKIIQEKLYDYNKLGKIEKVKFDVLDEIARVVFDQPKEEVKEGRVLIN